MDSTATTYITNGPVNRSGYLTIDLETLSRNYWHLTAEAATARVACVVKADAYGLGASQVSSRLYAEGCRDFFVAQFGEVAFPPKTGPF